MVTFNIEPGVQIPKLVRKRGQCRAGKYPFSQMSPGDSFAVSVREDGTQSITQLLSTLRSVAGTWAKRNESPMKFAVRAIDEHTARIWAVAPDEVDGYEGEVQGQEGAEGEGDPEVF